MRRDDSWPRPWSEREDPFEHHRQSGENRRKYRRPSRGPRTAGRSARLTTVKDLVAGSGHGHPTLRKAVGGPPSSLAVIGEDDGACRNTAERSGSDATPRRVDGLVTLSPVTSQLRTSDPRMERFRAVCSGVLFAWLSETRPSMRRCPFSDTRRSQVSVWRRRCGKAQLLTGTYAARLSPRNAHGQTQCPKEIAPVRGAFSERATGLEPSTLSLGSASRSVFPRFPNDRRT